MNFRQLIELFLMTGIMALIMSGAMTAYHLGVSEHLVRAWFSVYPIAWLIAIPAVLISRRIVQYIMSSFFKAVS